MDSLTTYSQKQDCVSRELRKIGNSDKCIEELLDILLQIGRDDPTERFNNSDFIQLMSSILYDTKPFISLDAEGNIVGAARDELLPNGIYRKLLVYIIINIDKLNKDLLDLLHALFTALEENNVSGFMYIPLNGRSYPLITLLLKKYNVEPKYGFHFVEYKRQVENHLIICNTTIVALIQNKYMN